MELDLVKRLSRDLASAATTLSNQEVRYLVDTYYIMQEDRKRANNQILALDKSHEPHSIITWLADQSTTLEAQIKRALEYYTDSHPIGQWLKSIYGVGPVISAGLLAHINIERAPTVGHIWRYAGLDPTSKWHSRDAADTWIKEFGLDIVRAAADFGQDLERLEYAAAHDINGKEQKITAKSLAAAIAKRPWNASLKTLCWKIGQSFMKFSGNENCYYGKIYRERKAYEIARNDAGGNTEAAAKGLKRVNKSTDAYKYYADGKLPPAQIDARARRYAVKLFLAHLHEYWYIHHYGKAPPLPYPIAILGHAHKIEVPNK